MYLYLSVFLVSDHSGRGTWCQLDTLQAKLLHVSLSRISNVEGSHAGKEVTSENTGEMHTTMALLTQVA